MNEAVFIRLNDVIKRVGLSQSQIYTLIREGTFPKPRKYPGSRSTFWLESEVAAWQQQVIEAANV